MYAAEANSSIVHKSLLVLMSYENFIEADTGLLVRHTKSTLTAMKVLTNNTYCVHYMLCFIE